MRFLFAALIMLVVVFAVRASDPLVPIPVPKDAAPLTVTEQLRVLKARVAALEAENAKLKAAAKAPCVCGDGCACPAGSCPQKCPVGQGVACVCVYPRVTHASPDGTVNELYTDGVYRAIAGAAPQAVPIYTAPVPSAPPFTYALPIAGGCANGQCGPAPARGLFFRR